MGVLARSLAIEDNVNLREELRKSPNWLKHCILSRKVYLMAIGQGFHAKPSPTLRSLSAGLKNAGLCAVIMWLKIHIAVATIAMATAPASTPLCSSYRLTDHTHTWKSNKRLWSSQAYGLTGAKSFFSWKSDTKSRNHAIVFRDRMSSGCESCRNEVTGLARKPSVWEDRSDWASRVWLPFWVGTAVAVQVRLCIFSL